jgi:hypothetical protein
MSQDAAYEIHMYAAVAKMAQDGRYPAGEQHPLLIFLRQQPESEHDFDTAADVAHRNGWNDVDFTKAGTLPEDAGENHVEPFHGCYLAAVQQGESILVYDTPVKEAPPKNKPANPEPGVH